MSLPDFSATQTHIDIAQMLRAVGDQQANVLAVYEKLAENTKDKAVTQVIGWALAQIAKLELAEFEQEHQFRMENLSAYERFREHRYRSSRMQRMLTLGHSAKENVDQAARGALEEVQALREECCRPHAQRMELAVAARMRMLECLARLLQGTADAPQLLGTGDLMTCSQQLLSLLPGLKEDSQNDSQNQPQAGGAS